MPAKDAKSNSGHFKCSLQIFFTIKEAFKVLDYVPFVKLMMKHHQYSAGLYSICQAYDETPLHIIKDCLHIK